MRARRCPHPSDPACPGPGPGPGQGDGARAPRGAIRSLLIALGALGALGTGGGCAAPGSDVHLAPVYSRFATAEDTTWTEMLGGAVFLEARGEDSPHRRGIRPLWSLDLEENGDWIAYMLAPLGYTRKRDDSTVSFLFPFYVFQSGPDKDGVPEWGYAGLPGLLMRYNAETGREVGWFPFFGRFENFLTFDDVIFVMWPLFVYAEAGGRQAWHTPWPVIGWSKGEGKDLLRLWPLYGRSDIEGRYRRRFWLWPFFHHQENHLGGGYEEPETMWAFFPFYGHRSRGTYRAHTVLWPLFGWASDPRNDFRSFDAPWPLVRYRRGGRPSSGEEIKRTRFWPFWGKLEADGLVATTYAWPLVHVREERYRNAQRDAFHVLPFWRSWDRVDLETGQEDSWRKLWPLYQEEVRGTVSEGNFPTLDPMWRNELLQFHYGWIWRIWQWRTGPDLERTRGLWGLWRRERDAGEDRRSLTVVWSDRRYVDAEERAVSETSFLLGLLRWRKTEGVGFEMLRPAFPGPGWPSERVPAPAAPAPRPNP